MSESQEDVAIVGMGCILPRADTPAQFWQNIVHKVDAISDPQPGSANERYSRPGSSISEPIYTGRGGSIDEQSRFNPIKYGIMPAGIDGAEPDQFIALRCAYDTLADAGVPGLPLRREKTGVILGRGVYSNRGVVSVFMHGFLLDQLIDVLRRLEPHRSEDDLALIRTELKRHLPPFNTEVVPGLMHCSMTGRIANRLDLNGPAYTLDAACASGLIAVEHAIRELRAGRCDAVLAGGVQGSTLLFVYQLFCHLEALSKRGIIAPFSKEAQGTLLGEGAAMVLLKRRSDAERDGNRIYALVKTVGVSSDGRGAGLLAPRTEGQQLAMRRAYEQAGIPTATVALIEGHGTGIPVGDKIEITSLRACFGNRVGALPTVALGSVKSMVGHLTPASSAVSLVKTALALYHRTLPPMLHAEEPNPDLQLETTPFYLCTQPRPWIHADRDTPRRAAIDAFGFGGINAHALLEEYPVADEAALERLETHWPCELVVVSAATPEALQRRVVDLVSWIGRAEGVRLLDVAASCAATLGPCRLALVVSCLDELSKKLTRAAKLLADGAREHIQDRRGVFWYKEPLARKGRLAFVFPGAGAQYPHMLADLCRHFPEVRRQFDLADAAYRRLEMAKPLSRVIFPLPEEEKAAQVELHAPPERMSAVMVAERGLLALLHRLGLEADAVVGHSNGEFIAFQAAGAFRVADDEALIQSIIQGLEVDRRQAAPDLLPDVRMSAVSGTNPAAIDAAVAGAQGKVVVAIDNCPHQVVLAGEPEPLASAVAFLQANGALCQELPVRALHTDAFAPGCEVGKRFYELVSLESPTVELWSCTHAAHYPSDPTALMDLAVRQFRCKLRFRETVLAMYAAGVRLFVEVGPRGNLSAFIADTLEKRLHAAVPLDLPRRPGLEQLCHALGMLAAHGVDLNLSELYRRRGPRMLDLNAEPPKAPALDPWLNRAMPEFQLSEAVVAQWRNHSRPGAAPHEREAAESAAPPAAERPISEPSNGKPAPTAAFGTVRANALADYQRTMRQFLETQEQVTLARFRAGSPKPGNVSPIAQRTPALARNGNGTSEAMSEARAPLSAPRQNPQPATAEPSRPAAPVQAEAIQVAEPLASPVSLEARLLEIVSERTGYPVEMLDQHANLEADLGIDSIKRVEIIAAFRRNVLPSLKEPPPDFMERMAGAKTLQAILDGVNALRTRVTADESPVAKAAGCTPALPLPFLEAILVREPHRLIAECELDVARHRFVLDHTFFGRGLSDRDPALTALPVMPLAVMLEWMAEAAAALQPTLVVTAMREVRTHRWLTFETTSRRVRFEATTQDADTVRVVVLEADREGMAAVIAEAMVELAPAVPDLGAPVVPDRATTPFPWTADVRYGRSQEEVYGRIAFHGPAFRGIVTLDAVDPHAARATVRVPDPALLLPTGARGDLVLPAGLIDQCGQIAVFGLVRHLWTEHEVLLTFPNRIERVEFVPRPPHAARLRAVASMRHEGKQLHSDVEFLDEGGRVVLRVMGRVEEVVQVPADLYAYWSAPGQLHLSRLVTGAFEGVPGADACTICAIGNTGTKLLVNQLWSQVLARMILSAEERGTYGSLKLPPVPAASWLLGRAVLKDAVRRHTGRGTCMADVEITTNEYGQPRVREDAAGAPLVSLAHKEFMAVALAADPKRFIGVGIDIEPLGVLDPGVREEAFTRPEQRLLEEAARTTGEALDNWYLAAWGAKEALGKALGRGVLGGPRSIEVVAVDAAAGRLSLALRGAMASAFPAYASGLSGTARLDAYRRLHGAHVLTLCLLHRVP